MLIGFSQEFKEKFAVECMVSPIWKHPENVSQFFKFFKDSTINFEKITAEHAKKLTVVGTYQIGEVGPLGGKKYTDKHVFFKNNMKFDWLLATKKEEFLIDAIFTSNTIIFLNIFNGDNERLMTNAIVKDKQNKNRKNDYLSNPSFIKYIEIMDGFITFDYDEPDDSNIGPIVVEPPVVVNPDNPQTGDEMHLTTLIHGNGNDRVFNISHNFNTKNVNIGVFDDLTGTDVLVETIRTGSNNIQVKFTDPVPSGQRYAVMISGKIGG